MLTNESEAQALKPPRMELPPTFLEGHGLQLAACAIVFFAALGCGIYLFLKPRRDIPEPPVVIVRRRLAELMKKEETGALIMEVSVALKHYLNRVLEFMPGEKTTAEFHAALSGQTGIPTELAANIAEFLKRCDEWKFSASPLPARLNVVEKAGSLVDSTESALQKNAEAAN
jgi:hypothetical protein